MKSKQYNHDKIEKKWQEYWRKKKIFETRDPHPTSPYKGEGNGAAADALRKPKQYILDMFPYPSGAGLHVGHPKGYIATDVISRMRIMQGYNVLHPMGWDAFGLPAENYAIKNKVHPSIATANNVKTFKKQLGLLGFTYDWSREINTTDPNYYKWTQWIFLQMFKRGLAYESHEPINWCPSCKTGLANEDLETHSTSSGQVATCERCGSVVEQKPLRQWVLKITDYAERLLKDLDLLDKWPEPIKEMQRNWIGRSEGAIVKFQIADCKMQIEVFTTRPDTLFGATYVVVAPEHELIAKSSEFIANRSEVEKYVKSAKNKSDLERTDLAKEKTGVELKGIKAINPANNEELPIFVADYVLSGYGTGAIMAVPAHDERDFEFAKKHGLPIREVIMPSLVDYTNPPQEGKENTQRKLVLIVLYDPQKKKYLTLKWKKQSWRTFVTGGVKESEDLEKSAIREIAEETGYKNVRLVRSLGHNETFFFAAHKNVNRQVHVHHFLFELIDSAQSNIAEEEKQQYDLEWLSLNELKSSVLQHAEKELILNRIENGDVAYTGDGKLINSGKFDGMNSVEAKKQIIDFVGGKMKTQYKLRDWVFSRQRYWGEPIPLVHCDNCADKKPKILLIHGYGGHDQENWFPWFKKEMENRGFEVLIPNLPDTDKPNFEKWLSALKKIDIDKKDKLYIIGHSLGCPTACHFIQRSGLGVEKLILVAPVGPSSDFEHLKKYGFVDDDVKIIRRFSQEKLNFDKLVNLIGNSKIYLSEDDPYIPLNIKDDYKKLQPFVKVFRNKGHFNQGAGILEFPEILEEFPLSSNTGWIPVSEKDLPLELPKVKHYEPSGTGESPLANIDKWVNTKCPVCGGPAKRETNTMPQWAGSCWYYLAYVMQGISNFQFPISNYRKAFEYWNPVDIYVGGAEHATRHLIYARFWHKFLYDIGAVNNVEPFTRLQNVGLILAEDGRKMSKRWGNVINPDDVVREYGADSMRLYEMFMGPFDQPCAWSMQGLVGMRRFLEKIWNLKASVIARRPKADEAIQEANGSPRRFAPRDDVTTLLHQTIKKVTDDIEAMRFNTAIASLMTLVNEMSKSENLQLTTYNLLLQLLSPFAPHITEELWSQLGNKDSITKAEWPKYDPELAKSEEMTIAVQVNGKLRDTITMSADASEETVKSEALKSEKVQKWLEGKEPKKVIYVRGKLVSVVV